MALMRRPPFSKILVANRGEIACRVFRTCRAHGIRTVAVYSEADVRALHVAMADEAVCIGPTPPVSSYLNIDAILAAVKQTRADAVHPGYGFLSERPEFARACAKANVVLIGPPAEAMEVMGDKVGARKAMLAAGVPLVPGVEDISNAAEAEAAAKTLGFPVMLKASAGGGGKGMRVVQDAGSLRRAYESATREAKAAFGDDRMFIERAVVAARHVEIQVMADAHGTVLHFGERDCSVQRRHQKVIEESPSPSPAMSQKLRDAMGDVAVKAARAVDYRGAGTVEFLFEETKDGAQFFFLEMNTRLQVEHPVTEAVVGRDLVWDQIRVAAGEPLGLTQADVQWRGHAIECRIYAEDPVQFLPRPGFVERVVWPQGPNVRVDAAITSQCEVSSHYDPMIAKLTVWGSDRAAAMAEMSRALSETAVLGIETNLPFHRRVLAEPDFRRGAVTTRYIDMHPALLATTSDDEGAALKRAVAAAASARTARTLAHRHAGAPLSHESHAWRRAARWRGNAG